MPAEPHQPGDPYTTGGRRVRRNPPKPRRAAPRTRAVMPGMPGYGTGPDVRARATPGSTSARVVVDRKTGRVTQPKYKSKPKPSAAQAWFESSTAAAAPPRGRAALEAQGIAHLGAMGLAGNPASGPLGFLRNAGGDLMDMITGVPAGAQILGENVAGFAPFSPVPYGRIAHLAGLRGTGWAEHYGQRVQNIDTLAAGAVADYYKGQYGPLLRGDLPGFWGKVKEHPLNTVLDIAGAKAAIARAPVGLARATRAVVPKESVTAGRITRALSGDTAAERLDFNVRNPLRGFQPGPGGLHRPPRVLRSRPTTIEEGRTAIPETTQVVPRRAYSRDVVNRAAQRAADRLRAGPGARLEARAERAQLPPGGERRVTRTQRRRAAVARPFTAQAKYERYQRGAALTTRDVFSARAESVFANNAPATIRAMNRLKGAKHPTTGLPTKGLSVEQAAARLHLDDVLPDPGKLRGGKSAPEIRDLWVRRTQGGQVEQRNLGKRTDLAREQLAVVKAIPDELLYLTGDSPAVKRVLGAVQEGRRLNRISQAQSQRAGVITGATRKEAGTRASALTVGGSVHWEQAVGKVAREFGRKITVVNRRIARARAAGDSATVRTLTREKARLVKARRGRVAYIKEQATRKTPELVKQRETTATTKGQLKRERAVVKTAGGSTRKVEALRKSFDAHAKRLAKLEAEARGFTPPRRPELVGKRGVYIRDVALDPRGGYTGPRRAGKYSGPTKAQRSKGVYKSAALADMNPNLLVEQARRATENWTGRYSPQALKELMGTAAYRDASGKFLTGAKASLERKLDPTKVAYVHQGKFVDALKELDGLPEGEWMPRQKVSEFLSDHIPEGARKSDYVVISKDAGDVWTEAMTSGNSLVRVGDKLLNYWKGGLLALSPRWYVNNTVGLALQYVLLTGGDFRAVFQANRMSRPIRGAMAKRHPEIVVDTLADELVGKASLPKLMRVGFRINSKLEEFWRRGAYLSRAKKGLRERGLRLRDMSDAEVARAIETMPEPMAASIVRDIDFFIGNYRKFNKYERTYFKRVLPFYSWLRVIARLTFVLPFRSPTRALALATLNKAQEAGLNPTDKALDYFERGPLDTPVGKVATWSLNPWQSLAGVVAALGDDNPAGRLLQEALGWMHPGLQAGAQLAFGKNPFGQGIISPPGTVPFGRAGALKWNPITKHYERQEVRLSFWEAAIQTLAPGQISIIKSTAQAVAGNKVAYGDTSTAQLLGDLYDRWTGGKGNDKLYLPVKGKRAREPARLNVFTRPFGLPLYNQDDAAVVREAKQKIKDAEKERKTLERSARRG